MITQKIKLNLIPGRILPRIKASQYDSGARTLKFQLYNGVQEFIIPSGSTVSIRGTKSDHTGFQYECEYSGSEVTTKITDQMTVSPGEVLAELVITKDDDRIATENFIFENEEAALKEDVIVSKTDIPAIERLDELVEEAEEAKDSASSSATAAAGSATDAAGSATAASASASQAAGSATSASTSATNAANSASSAVTSATNAASSETNAASSATAASGSASDAAASATSAAGSATSASTSATNAANSETNARLWAVGQTGSGSNIPSDTNNAYYWSQRAEQAASGGLHKKIVNSLPTINIDTNTIYLVPSADPETQNAKDEYINTDGTVNGWELIGSTKVDLSDYYTKTQIDTALSSKQNTLTFDSSPTENSTNPVTSGGIKTAIDNVSPSVDNVTILKSQNNVLSANIAIYPTIAAAQAAAQANQIPENAIVYVPGGNEGTYYTKSEIDTQMATKANKISYNSKTGKLSLKNNNTEISNATIGKISIPSFVAFNQRVDRNWDGLSVLSANATDVTTDFDNGTLSTKIAAGNFDDYDLGMQIKKTITIDNQNYVAHIIFAHANAFFGAYYSSYVLVNTPNIGCVVYVEDYTSTWNASNTDGGYTSSNLRTSIQNVVNAVKSVLGDSHMVSHKVLLTNAVSGGKSSGWEWVDGSYGEAMSAAQMCGTGISGSYFDTAEAYEQLALFSHVRPNLVYGNVVVWLRDVLTDSGAAALGGSGYLGVSGVIASACVSPLILLK